MGDRRYLRLKGRWSRVLRRGNRRAERRAILLLSCAVEGVNEITGQYRVVIEAILEAVPRHTLHQMSLRSPRLAAPAVDPLVPKTGRRPPPRTVSPEFGVPGPLRSGISRAPLRL